MTNTDDLWYMYGQQILQQAAPAFDSSKQTFSLAASTLSIDLGNADSTIVNDYVYNLGNTIPAASPAYAPGSALLTSFQLFLDAIDLQGDANPNLDSQIAIAASAMTAAQTNFISVQAAAVAAWKNYQAINPAISFSDYTIQQYPTYVQAKNALSGSTSKWQQLMTQKYGQGYELIADARNRLSATGGASDITMANSYNMPVKTGSVAAAGSVPMLPGQIPQPSVSSLISSFAPGFTLEGFAPIYQQWQANSASKAAPAASIHVTGDASGASWTSMGWSSESAGLFTGGFFDAFGQQSASGSSQSSFSFSDGFDMQIDFVGLSSFVIQPGQWFDLGIVERYKGQLLPNSPAFFAANGPLARLPYEAVVGFNPSITLMMSNSDYSTFKSTFQSESTSAFGFGPFVLGETHSSTYADKSAVAFSDSGASITISPPPSAIPVLLGVISSRLDS